MPNSKAPEETKAVKACLDKLEAVGVDKQDISVKDLENVLDPENWKAIYNNIKETNGSLKCTETNGSLKNPLPPERTQVIVIQSDQVVVRSGCHQVRSSS